MSSGGNAREVLEKEICSKCPLELYNVCCERGFFCAAFEELERKALWFSDLLAALSTVQECADTVYATLTAAGIPPMEAAGLTSAAVKSRSIRSELIEALKNDAKEPPYHLNPHRLGFINAALALKRITEVERRYRIL